MNKVCLIGRITKDPEIRYGANQIPIVMFNVAVDRKYKNQDGSTTADFLPCTAFRQQADFISRYVQKGNLLSIVGSLQSRSYTTQNGENRVVIEVIVDEVSNLTPRPQQTQQAPRQAVNQQQQTMVVDDSDLPF